MSDKHLRKIGRALTVEEKRIVIERVFNAWLNAPAQRLGQFIENAISADGSPRDAFNVEDKPLADHCEAYGALAARSAGR